VKTFHSLRVTSPVHTRTTAALECWHLPHQVRPLNCYFQQYELVIPRVSVYDSSLVRPHRLPEGHFSQAKGQVVRLLRGENLPPYVVPPVGGLHFGLLHWGCPFLVYSTRSPVTYSQWRTLSSVEALKYPCDHLG